LTQTPKLRVAKKRFYSTCSSVSLDSIMESNLCETTSRVTEQNLLWLKQDIVPVVHAVVQLLHY